MFLKLVGISGCISREQMLAHTYKYIQTTEHSGTKKNISKKVKKFRKKVNRIYYK